jgi:hypothetical protein
MGVNGSCSEQTYLFSSDMDARVLVWALDYARQLRALQPRW